jgi:MFS family permease
MPVKQPKASASPHVLLILAPIMAVVLIAFLVIGLALPVLPLHVHQGLGLGAYVVGLVAGSQFAVSFMTRLWSGRFADTRGAKRAVVLGLLAAVAAGGLYLLSSRLTATPILSVTVLIVGRGVLGGAESFIITGAVGWGLALVEESSAGRVIAWIGTAMYVAFAVGAPIGSALYAAHGFVAIALATALLPLVALAVAAPLKADLPRGRAPPTLTAVIGSVLAPGLGLAFSSIGFGAMTTFLVLLFADHDWTPAWLPFTAFAVAFIAARVFLGQLPDKLGGAQVALVFALVEAAGLAMVGLAPGPGLAVAGAVLTGVGYSLVYPGLGLEAVRRAPPQSRAMAMGAYTAFLDLSLGVASPLLGVIAGRAGFAAVFLVGAVLVLGAAAIAIRLVRSPVEVRT